ncbi:phosphoribosylaminoimidazole-succinocarboxamide synthase [Monosporozyma servazzii]
MSLVKTELDGILPLVARGKVRDIYEVDENTLLFIATDRISAYDVIMSNPIPDKGKLLTRLSEFWFNFLKDDILNHLVEIPQGKTLFDFLPMELGQDKYRHQLEGRSLLVHKHKLIPLEVIVRGYITGSAWKEYVSKGTVHDHTTVTGLKESQQLPESVFTPSTKAEQGEHDENISVEKAEKLVGEDLCRKIDVTARKLYDKCALYAKSRGIIIADTKFEFGITATGELVLVDEVLTPDSSRFWNAQTYEVGRGQDSYDKQFLRDWLTSNGVAGQDGVSMPQDIVEKTRAKYIEAFEALTGEKYL